MDRPLEHATDAQLVVMTQQYTMDRSGAAYVTHLAYEEINARSTADNPWGKCMDCGNPFPGAVSGNFCSEACETAYLASM